MFLTHRTIGYLEAGLFVKLVRYTYSVGLENYLRENLLFVSLEQYKKGLIKFDEMRFENYEMLFELYITICMSILVVFVYSQIRNRLYNKFQFSYQYKIKRFSRRFRSRLIRNLKKLWQAKKNFLKKRTTVKQKLKKNSTKRIKINFLQKNLFRSF